MLGVGLEGGDPGVGGVAQQGSGCAVPLRRRGQVGQVPGAAFGTDWLMAGLVDKAVKAAINRIWRMRPSSAKSPVAARLQNTMAVTKYMPTPKARNTILARRLRTNIKRMIST